MRFALIVCLAVSLPALCAAIQTDRRPSKRLRKRNADPGLLPDESNHQAILLGNDYHVTIRYLPGGEPDPPTTKPTTRPPPSSPPPPTNPPPPPTTPSPQPAPPPVTSIPSPSTPPPPTVDPMCPEGKNGVCRELPPSKQGSIQVRNNGFIILHFSLEYKVRHQKIVKESDMFSYSQKRTIDIPADAEDIVLTVHNAVGKPLAYIDILKRQWKYPVIRCFASTDGRYVYEVVDPDPPTTKPTTGPSPPPTTTIPSPSTPPPPPTVDPMCPDGKNGVCRELPPSKQGSIQVHNKGSNWLQFLLEYTVRHQKIVKESMIFTYGLKRKIDIPADAEDIILTVQHYPGELSVTNDVLKRQWKYPVIRCFATTNGRTVYEVGCD